MNAPPLANRALAMLAACAIIALLHFARAVVVPVILAALLCFAINPLVHALRRLGLGRLPAALVSVTTAVAVVAVIAALIGAHALRMRADLPAYQARAKSNLQSLRITALAPLENALGAMDTILDPPTVSGTDTTYASLLPPLRQPPYAAIPVEIRRPDPAPIERLQHLLSWLLEPLGSAGIVVIVLIFLLIEWESLRDRCVRLIGNGDVRAATSAINDAGERLSQYLARQLAINIGFGLTIWAALAAIGLPQAALFAVLAAVLRFVPYVGVLAAAACAMLMALGSTQGWPLLMLTGAAFLAIDAVTSHAIEPRVYGHATGLSPLAVVLAALFWGWLWGPVGVIIATPLTMCLAVAGRHTKSLRFLDIALGDRPALTMAQKFYQRALSGDPGEILTGARAFLKRRPFAAYCDEVLLPALQLSRADFAQDQITLQQQAELRDAIVRVLEALDGAKPAHFLPLRRIAATSEDGSGALLREKRVQRRRETNHAPHDLSQKPSQIPAPIVLCIGTGLPGDDLVTEILVRILCSRRFDARHLTVDELRMPQNAAWAAAPPGPAQADQSGVSAVCLVTMAAHVIPRTCAQLVRDMRIVAPGACMIALIPGLVGATGQPGLRPAIDHVARSCEEVVRTLQTLAETTLAPAA
jgi:predicted PurR-regulated permease PerM